MVAAAASLAAAAIAPVSSLAVRGSLKLEVAGKQLTGGAPMLLTSTNVTISNNSWSLACSETSLKGSLAQNLKEKDNSFLVTEGGMFGGGGEEGRCAAGTTQFVAQFKPTQTPELTLNTKGKALLHFVALRLVPPANINKTEEHQEACTISATNIRGTFNITETPQPLVVTFPSAKMKMVAQGAECGAGAEARPQFSATFTATTRESAVVEVALFNKH
jgi:hypothetical protein